MNTFKPFLKCYLNDRKRLNETLGVYAPYHYDDIFENFKIADKNLLDNFVDEHTEQVCGLVIFKM